MPPRKRTRRRRRSVLQVVKGLFNRKTRVRKVDLSKRFDLLGQVGPASMSKVWRARDLVSGRMVALKVLDPVKTRRFESRFIGLNKPTEGEVAVTLLHPNIVRTYEHGVTLEGYQYLVMEFIEGISLSYLVDVQNDTIKKNRMRFILGLGEAVEYLHKENWIHRDICPRNVLLDQNMDWHVKLIDFGLVVPNTEPFRRPGNRTGTAAYMAPELIKRVRTDERLDIFSFAISCYEIYTGRHPWQGGVVTLETVVKHLNHPPKDIREVCPDVDEQVAHAIMKGLAQDPDRRWRSMDDMLAPLREARRRLEPHEPEAVWESPVDSGY